MSRDIDRSNEVFAQGSSSQSRSTFGSIDEDSLLQASVEVEDKRNRSELIPNERQGNLQAPLITNQSDQQAYTSDSTLFPSNGVPNYQGQTSLDTQSPLKMSYEVRDLPNQNLFVGELPKALEHVPYHILFICQRLAIEHSVEVQHLVRGMDVSTVSSDPEAFWRFIETNNSIV